MRGFVLGALLFSGCSTQAYGEALVFVDTDAAPMFVGRMRLDVYALDGTWLESRDTPTLAYPLSFSVYTPDLLHAHEVLLRVRLYPQGDTRDYQGEAFLSREVLDPTALALPAPPADRTPRLLKDGKDITPAKEPDPSLTIDRLLRVKLTPGVRGRMRVTLRGGCIGTMADLANRRTCVDQDRVLVPVDAPAIEPDMSAPAPIEKSFGAPVPCPANARPRPNNDGLFDEEVCVPGGGFILGDPSYIEPTDKLELPQRPAILPPFLMDRYEVTVGRWRDALSRGFQPPVPAVANDTPISRDTCNPPKPDSDAWCTFTTKRGAPEDRERYPINCVPWGAAQAFCAFEGGSLPSEAQWEYVAQAYGRANKTENPWGTELFDCIPWTKKDRAVRNRLGDCGSLWQEGFCLYTINGPFLLVPAPPVCGNNDGSSAGCRGAPVVNPRQGPQPEDAAADGDRSFELGVVNMGGSMSELVLDSFLALNTQCWVGAPLHSPVCSAPSYEQHTIRGSSWAWTYQRPARGTVQATGLFGTRQQVGFRCVRPL